MKAKVISVPTEDISKIVQEKLFELGYKWAYNGKNYISCYGKNLYICLKNDKSLSYASRSYFFKEHNDEYEEINMYDLYQMEPVKDTVTLTTEDGRKIEISRKSLEELKKIT